VAVSGEAVGAVRQLSIAGHDGTRLLV